jgi:hypothetical protein
MFHPSEQKYNVKIQKVQSLMQMIGLKFQSLNLYYKGEVEELHSQLVNRSASLCMLYDPTFSSPIHNTYIIL